MLHKLLQKAAVRLRSYDYMAGGLQLGIKCVNGSRWSRQMRFDHTWDTIQLSDVLERLWSQRPKGKPLMPFARDEPLTGKTHLTELRDIDYGFRAFCGVNRWIWQRVQRSCNVFAADSSKDIFFDHWVTGYNRSRRRNST